MEIGRQDVKVSIQCFTRLSLSRLYHNTSQYYSFDYVDQACGKDLEDRDKIEKYDCWEGCKDGRCGMFLKYKPVQPTKELDDRIKIHFEQSITSHSNRIDDIKSGVSWEGACSAMRSELEDKGYVSVSSLVICLMLNILLTCAHTSMHIP